MKLLGLNLPPAADKIIELIISIARHKHEVRTDAEAGKAEPAAEETKEERHRRELMESDDPGIWTRLS